MSLKIAKLQPVLSSRCVTADGDARVMRENDTEAKGVIEKEKKVQRYLHYPKSAYIIHEISNLRVWHRFKEICHES